MSLLISTDRLARLNAALEVALDCIGTREPSQTIRDHARTLDGAAIELRYLLREVKEALKVKDI